ncbi:SUN domain-containing protein 2-like [Coturnix japonica]|uniref:SUN domain-containing protein 2-like n=1 Tax=Coturnix japonica TaxID=93934 RepID=UPI0013A5E68A|nr:SUN domain-containing protein 2-like [Coturnix japonica]
MPCRLCASRERQLTPELLCKPLHIVLPSLELRSMTGSHIEDKICAPCPASSSASQLMDASLSFQPDVSAGSCWAFQGSQGHAVIQLPENIWPTAFTMWHVSKAVSPSGDVSSAPRDFAILGVDEDEKETLLGSFVYDVDGEIAQTFHVQEKPLQSYKRIKMDVRSNWGNAEYTCVYRVEIHGNP